MSDTTEFARRIEFIPAYDKRHRDPNKDYGIGAMKIRFVLVGPLGATQFLMSTGWYLPSVVTPGMVRREAQWMEEHGTALAFKPDGWDLGYHSPEPLWDGQNKMRECDYIPGGCYYDGSGLNAEPVLDAFLKDGEPAVWKALEDYYRACFVARVTA